MEVDWALFIPLCKSEVVIVLSFNNEILVLKIFDSCSFPVLNACMADH